MLEKYTVRFLWKNI